MGDFQKAFIALNAMDKTKFTKKQLLAYEVDLLSYFYASGEFDSAEEIFQNEFALIPKASSALTTELKLISAQRLLYLEHYNDSRDLLNAVLKKNTSLRNQIYTQYFLALIDEKEGKNEDALIKFREVADKGNKLWIAQQARLKLK